MTPLFFTPEQLAQRWNITTRTLSQWRWNGRGPHYAKMSRRILYRISDIEDYERSKRRRSTSDMPSPDQEYPVQSVPFKKSFSEHSPLPNRKD